jgi:hypothetical protein
VTPEQRAKIQEAKDQLVGLDRRRREVEADLFALQRSVISELANNYSGLRELFELLDGLRQDRR